MPKKKKKLPSSYKLATAYNVIIPNKLASNLPLIIKGYSSQYIFTDFPPIKITPDRRKEVRRTSLRKEARMNLPRLIRRAPILPGDLSPNVNEKINLVNSLSTVFEYEVRFRQVEAK